jgi:hypothetical protein
VVVQVAAAPVAAGSAAGTAARVGAQVAKKGAEKTAQSTAKGAQKTGEAAGRVASRGAQTARRGAQRGGQAAQRYARQGGQPARYANTGRNTARNLAQNRPGGSRGPGGARGPGSTRPGARAGNQRDVPRQQRNRSRQFSRLRPDYRKRLRAKRRDLLGQRDPEELDNGEKTVRFVGRRLKRLVRLDSDQGLRRRVRRTLVTLLVLTLVFFLPFLNMWLSADDEKPPDDLLAFEVQPPVLGSGPIPEELMPIVAELTGIPMDALRAYSAAAGGDWAIDWVMLAGIGKVECDHGRNRTSYCSTPHNVWLTSNGGAGERGPMQHLGHLWRVGHNDPDEAHVEGPPTPRNNDSTHVATDGDGDGIADPWNWYDAVASTARKLTLYKQELARMGTRFDTPEFLIGSYNAGVAGTTGFGRASSPTNATYVRNVQAEMNRIRTATAYLNLGATGGGSVSGGRVEQTATGPITVVTVKSPSGASITVNATIANQLQQMLAAAHADGVRLSGGGFRSYQAQIDLRIAHCGGNTYYNIYEKPSSQCSPPTARPGGSNHERGLAIDFENCGSHSTACWQWLNQNAARFGFHNFPVEPWHWSLDGR